MPVSADIIPIARGLDLFKTEPKYNRKTLLPEKSLLPQRPGSISLTSATEDLQGTRQ
jgi:hypothetical protein